MRRLAVLVVVAALMSPMVASGQDYSFGDWARDQGYSPGDVMPFVVDTNGSSLPAIDSLDGIGEFDWTTTPTTELYLGGNQLSSIESGDFSGLTNLTELYLGWNQLSSIESGDFSGLANLKVLQLRENRLTSLESGAFSGLPNLEYLLLFDNAALTTLNMSEADFSNLTLFDVGRNVSVTSVSLRDTVVNQKALAAMLDGGEITYLNDWPLVGIGELGGIIEMDLSGVDFADITTLRPLYVLDDLTDLWLVDTQNLDAMDLDVLLDNLETIEGTDAEGILYMTEADFDVFNAAGDGLLSDWDAEPGHHVEYSINCSWLGDVNLDGVVNGLDVDPFVAAVVGGTFLAEGDMNEDGVLNGLDVDFFVAAVVGSSAEAIPEPSTLLLCLIALVVVGGWRRCKRVA